jgi:hypothetical protein
MTRPVFQHRFKLTYGRRNLRLHQYPACVAAMAQENETILELGIDCQIELRFVHLDPARIKRSPGRLQDQLCSTLQAAFITAPSITRPRVTYFHNATSSFRANATMIVLFRWPPFRWTRSLNHKVNADCG